MSSHFQSHLAEHGIFHQVPFPFTPEQNGCAERKHRHIVETGLTLLFNAHMPTQYYVEAFLTATYLIKRMPTLILHVSPWQLLFGCAPD